MRKGSTGILSVMPRHEAGACQQPRSSPCLPSRSTHEIDSTRMGSARALLPTPHLTLRAPLSTKGKWLQRSTRAPRAHIPPLVARPLFTTKRPTGARALTPPPSCPSHSTRGPAAPCASLLTQPTLRLRRRGGLLLRCCCLLLLLRRLSSRRMRTLKLGPSSPPQPTLVSPGVCRMSADSGRPSPRRPPPPSPPRR